MGGRADEYHATLWVVQVILEGRNGTGGRDLNNTGTGGKSQKDVTKSAQNIQQYEYFPVEGTHPASRDGTADVGLVSKILVRDVIFGADENTAGSIRASRN